MNRYIIMAGEVSPRDYSRFFRLSDKLKLDRITKYKTYENAKAHSEKGDRVVAVKMDKGRLRLW